MHKGLLTCEYIHALMDEREIRKNIEIRASFYGNKDKRGVFKYKNTAYNQTED
jgi:hypothetical protein